MLEGLFLEGKMKKTKVKMNRSSQIERLFLRLILKKFQEFKKEKEENSD